jgi:hypothetical protein
MQAKFGERTALKQGNLSAPKHAQILADSYYLRCISLALRSKGEERFGCLAVKNGEVIGEGFNRAIATPAFKLDRIIRQGYANHAEIEAMNDALSKGYDIRGCELFTAGYFPDLGRLEFTDQYNCMKCIPYMERYGIAGLNDPMPNGWVKKSLGLALAQAKVYTNGIHQKRINASIGNFSIDLYRELLRSGQVEISKSSGTYRPLRRK